MKRKMGYLYAGTIAGVATLFGKAKSASAETGDLDSIEGYDSINGAVTNPPATSDAGTTGNFFKGWKPVTDEQMATGSAYAQPFVNFFGNIIGFGLTVVVGWIGLQTVIDLVYWGIPPLRGIMAKQNPAQQTSGMGMGMGGQQEQSSSKLPVFVSDDMLQAMESGGNQSSQGGIGGGMGMSGGMNGGMGGMYGGMGGGMGGAQQEPPKRKNILLSYAKKRVLTIVILGVCVTVLFSSILLDTGINLGAFAIKIIEFLNGLLVSNT